MCGSDKWAINYLMLSDKRQLIKMYVVESEDENCRRGTPQGKIYPSLDAGHKDISSQSVLAGVNVPSNEIWCDIEDIF